MEARTKRAPKLRKIDIRVPVPQERGAGRDAPLFDAVDRALLRAIDGRATVHSIAVAAGRSDEEVARSLAKLERLQIISFATGSRRPVKEPPKRLESGMRPALATLPTDVTAKLEEAASNDEDVHERPTLPPPSRSAYGDDPEARQTLTGIGPRAAAR
jgi:hypothetical protein